MRHCFFVLEQSGCMEWRMKGGDEKGSNARCGSIAGACSTVPGLAGVCVAGEPLELMCKQGARSCSRDIVSDHELCVVDCGTESGDLVARVSRSNTMAKVSDM